MKRISLLVCLFLGALSDAVGIADEMPPFLKIEGVKAVYSLKEPVAVSVTNLSTHVVTYSIGVLVRENGKWEERLTNIEDRELYRKALKLRKLPGNHSEKFAWNPKDTSEPYPIRKGVYRFYVAFSAGDSETFQSEISRNIGTRVGEHNRHLIFSDAFELHP